MSVILIVIPKFSSSRILKPVIIVLTQMIGQFN